jgi:putative multiple sugar transport system ATP-binding protein
MNDYILEMKNIIKEFPGVRALNNVNFQVKQGEIHCLVGENGAGKSTLMKVLSGIYPYGSYAGDILVGGQIQKYRNIKDSEASGIAIIYQELALIPELSVYENIFFGHEIIKGNRVNWNQTIVQASEIMKKVGLKVNPSEKVKMLGIGNQQLVEIAKALSRDVKILILDEPTAALNETDSINLLNLLKELKSHGVTCILISHKLQEIISIADTVTVLRDGATISSLDAKKGLTEQEIMKYMVGREICNMYPKRENVDIGEICFEIKNWTVEDKKKERDIIKDVSINIRKGEIIGIQGLMGAGRTELALSIFGNVQGFKIKSGELYLNGKRELFRSPKEAIDAGVAYASEDRKEKGLVLIQDIRYNISISNLAALMKGFVINQNEEINVAKRYMDSINIKASSVNQKVFNLSGGNQQKVQLAKWMYLNPQILILDEPTRGIDVGAKYEIYCLMNKLVENGMSIIMISSELQEVLGMSDRIYVMSQGKITGELSTSEATEEKIMMCAIKS